MTSDDATAADRAASIHRRRLRRPPLRRPQDDTAAWAALARHLAPERPA